MSRLSVYSVEHPDHLLARTEKGTEIAEILASQGVRFERWEAGHTLAHHATSEEILSAYAEAVARLKQECGFLTVDVVHMKADNPQKKAFREKFLEEHTHSEDEVRFFVEGQGMFYLHLDSKIFMTLCCKGDLISVPAGTRHWFDMGDQPEFTAIRFFNNPEGWVANFTGAPIASSFPRMPFKNRVILLDIEGTTGSISFVRDTLFPYARKNLADYLAANRDSARVAGILAEVAVQAGVDGGDLSALVTVLQNWIDSDLKATPLKELQGLIWEDGYQNGDYTAHVYADAEKAMKSWHEAGYALYVYSSGSVKAQNLFYQYSDFGDMRPLFKGYFDTKSGSKKEADSYMSIARAIGHAPGEILFLSDVIEELDAARQAGMSTGWLVRDAARPEKFDHDCFTDFSQIDLI